LLTLQAFDKLRKSGAWDVCHGLKMRYTNPITGNHAMATMATFIQLLPRGFATAAYRSTDATVFVPIEGKGRSVISPRSGEDIVVEWCKRDIFVVPSWHRVHHQALDGDAVIFSYSDRPIQEALHLFREDRGNA
jgi:gentisate 1,2-dioxygenase